MNLPEICIRRPVFATVLSLVIVLVGLVSFQRLTVREYPNVDPPVVTVETTYPGASSTIMESQVTQVLEDSLAGLEGVDVMSSISREQFSQITLTFSLSREPESAASDVRDRVARARGALPEEVSDPVVQKTEADAQPVMYVGITSDRHNRLELTDYAERNLKDRLQALSGVAFVRVMGSSYAMRLWLDPERLAAYRLTPTDVEDALRRQNVEVPAGRIESQRREFTVLSETDLRTAADFDQLIIREADDYIVRLSDVGRAELGGDNSRFGARFNGREAVGMGIVKQSTANPLEVSRHIRAEVEEISKTLPEGMELAIPHDAALFIQASIDNVYQTIGEAVLLVVLIIFLFLRSVRATLIPLVTIPVSLIGACTVMAAFGFSINTLTLLAAVLAVGLVVDDAIVMLENIYRHIEEGMTPMAAAIKGSKEIGFAIVAMTLTLAAVYAPVGFQPGTTGKLFTEFAWTLAAAVLVSGFAALTLSPMMCGHLLKPHGEQHGHFYTVIEDALNALTRGYTRLLRAGLNTLLVPLVLGLTVAVGGGWLFTQLKSELSPREDRGLIIGAFVAPEGSTLEYTNGYARKLEEVYAKTPEINRYFVITGFPVVTNGMSFVRLKDWAERDRSVFQVAQALGPQMFNAAPGVLAFPITPGSLGQGAFGKPVNIVIQTTAPYDELAKMMDKLMARVGKIPGLVAPESDLKLNKPQLRVELDRDKAAAMGVSPIEVGRALETFLGGRQVTRFKREGQQYDVLVQLDKVDRSNPADLNRLYVRGPEGMVGLANVIKTREGVAPKELNHFNQLRAATLTANLTPQLALGDAVAQIEQAVREELPGAQMDYSGQTREFKQSSAGIALTFGLALVFIYLVLAAQFESFRDPLIILFTVPLSMGGALLALKLAGGTNNIYSQVGLVTLIGLITKHGILIVEFAHQLQAAGKSKLEAVVEACALRLRPILMTTGAMVLGALPLALADGAGAEARSQIGWVIVGGLTVGTLFTLFVIPAVYLLLASRPAALEAPTASHPSTA